MKMNKKKMLNALTKFFKEEKITDLVDCMIYQETDGSYQLFDQYSIQKKNGTFILKKNHTYTQKTFISLRNAATWATLDKCQKFTEANRVLELDLLLSGANENLKVHDQLSRKAKDTEQLLIYLVKMEEDNIKKQTILYELDSYITTTKNWQQKQFAKKVAKSSQQ